MAAALTRSAPLLPLPARRDGGHLQVLLDLNTERDDGTLALRVYSFSKDGSLFACGLSEAGSDWMTIKVKNVATGEWVGPASHVSTRVPHPLRHPWFLSHAGEDLPDTIPWVKFCGIT